MTEQEDNDDSFTLTFGADSPYKIIIYCHSREALMKVAEKIISAK